MAKTFTNQFLLILFLLNFTLSTPASANTLLFEQYPDYVEQCAATGLKKLKAHAAARNHRVREESFVVQAVEDRWYSPHHYVWYGIEAQNVVTGHPTYLTKSVQYSRVEGWCR